MHRDGAAEIALLISSYQRPRHLARALASVQMQQGVAGAVEVVVTDDGSRDETIEVVARFAARVDHCVKLTTHVHQGFQLARCRNEGVAASTAPYLLLLDGDCLLPPGHVRQHLLRRRPRTVMAGDCCRLEQDDSEAIDEAAIGQGRFPLTMPDQERQRLRWQDVKARFYQLIRHPTKPKLIGNNVGIWRSDFVAINGFDEQYEGWGCEDDDLRLRLRKQGIRVASILRWTHGYHMWHPPAPSLPQRWRDGANVEYLRQWRRRPARCQRGLFDLSCGSDHHHDQVPYRRPFVETIFWPGKGQFSGRASCNVLAVAGGTAPPPELASAADHCVPQRTVWRALDGLVEQQHAVASDQIVVPDTVFHRQAG